MSPVTVSVANAVSMTGLSTATLYRLIARDKLDSIKVGRRRLIRVDSLMKMMEQYNAHRISSGWLETLATR